jgi:hypothetical protein
MAELGNTRVLLVDIGFRKRSYATRKGWSAMTTRREVIECSAQGALRLAVPACPDQQNAEQIERAKMVGLETK